MTPFDPAALLAMLLSFYPIVSGAELLRARSERPEYFAGGDIIGRHFDALRLPDGRVFDLIFDVDGLPGAQRWQVIIPGGGGGGDAFFPLEPGALVPMDERQWPRPAPVETFAPLVAEALDELQGADETLWRAGDGVTSGTTPGELLDAFTPIDDGERARVEQFAGLDLAVPADVLERSEGHGHRIDASSRDYDEPAPPDIDLSPLPPSPAPDVPDV